MAQLWLSKLHTWHLLLGSAVLRLGLILFAEYQDANFEVKYTDVDYTVFTDAARFVARGRSPFLRSTYRYSPVLAYLMLPNVWLHHTWGKVLFAAGDLLAALLLAHILKRQAVPPPGVKLAQLAWLCNPFTVPISTRGSCDVLSVLLLLLLLAALMHGRTVAAALLYGLAVHFRIYPVIYGPSIALFLLQQRVALEQDKVKQHLLLTSAGQADSTLSPSKPPPLQQHEAPGRDLDRPAGRAGLRARPGARTGPSSTDAAAGGSAAPTTPPQATGVPAPATNPRNRGAVHCGTPATKGARCFRLFRGQGGMPRLAAACLPAAVFGLVSAATFLALGVLFCWLYGNEFLREAFLHHLTRKDPRHNFSPYYLPIYFSFYDAQLDHKASSQLGHDAGPGPPSSWHPAATPEAYDTPPDPQHQQQQQPAGPGEASRLALLPQAAVLLVLALRFHRDLPAAWLLQTWAFVTFNKVVTAQYFVWYLSLLPLVLPRLLVQRHVPRVALAAAGAVWLAAQLHWLAWAAQLEFKGRSVHLGLWMAGLVFMAANTLVIVLLVLALRLRGRSTFLDDSLALMRPVPAGAIQAASNM